MPNAEDKILEVQNLKKYFTIKKGLFGKKSEQLKAVDDISFFVNRGETLGIVGESGCGKSTTGNAIMRLLTPTSGEIFFDGEDFSKLSSKALREKRKDMQMIFQDPFSSLNPRMKVFDIIAEPLRTHHSYSTKQLKSEVLDLMEKVGLSEAQAYRFPHEFSGGQRQRIGIARAIALKPKIIVCDEPVSALDVSIQAQILNLLKKLQKDMDLTFVFIAHGLPAVKHFSDRVAVMYLGKIVEMTTKNSCFDQPMHPYTIGLLEAVPIADPTRRKKHERPEIKGDIPSPINLPTGCRFHTRCPMAAEKCKVEIPEFEEKEAGHYVACHFPVRNKD
ncbi:LOW QUALITY PROTEIN: oligopeptide transport ATP-binding protein OppF [Geomicrobium sp. JCM 19037]|nr:LOW QUALITY PROTEIN: oligopeptide transport ATP-binding protein OppF [Geomicrobium sp. JCM 19037]